MVKKLAVKKRYFRFRYKNQTVSVLLDKVLIFRFLKSLQNRFWGVAGISMMSIGFAICFAIRPDLRDISTAFSDFGNDIRTAPYFSGSVFLGAYGMWRWRSYLSRTWKRTMPVTGLVTLTVLGLYVVALVPVGWNSRVHIAGMTLAGLSMLATVVIDGLLTKSRKLRRNYHWRGIRLLSFLSIVIGGWLTLGSSPLLEYYDVSLLGELLIIYGYLSWVGMKTYHGEGNRTVLAKRLKKIVIIS